MISPSLVDRHCRHGPSMDPKHAFPISIILCPFSQSLVRGPRYPRTASIHDLEKHRHTPRSYGPSPQSCSWNELCSATISRKTTTIVSCSFSLKLTCPNRAVQLMKQPLWHASAIGNNH
ncbi:hypothetical protein FVEG_17382 [Fusarium verticillioides 7600]|uniref:Uncharacterized protein n=1 Tax=Gibberella moniliformis (strain M3125 / FGSC 7600) TaxID=334819 RepID=W7N510_GIBM7|nr:hypothetical protein FVEG_17382 [Fusarium verticillioides 7600]EWG54729.1 hypothetical protein FVEG_17382 [Fusarium verticillioides 7600]